MAYNPFHYDFPDIFNGENEIPGVNNGHRNIKAYDVPAAAVPLVCSQEDWERIQERERAALYAHFPPPSHLKKEEPLLKPRNRDSSFNKGYVREIRGGSWCERRLSSCVSGGCNICVLPRMPDFSTGETLKPYIKVSDMEYDGENLYYDYKDVKFMASGTSRADNLRKVRETCNRFKWLVRANERLVKLFITLTYAENMTDTKRLYEDLRRFVPKLRRLCPSMCGYLAACEPQKRGAWHVHLLLLSSAPVVYVANRRVNKKWGHGFTKVQSCRSVRDVGTYLTSYLSNLKDGKGTKKNARLSLYPLGFRFTRWSRDILRPEKTTFYGMFGDSLRGADDAVLCYDFQNDKRLPDGVRVLSRIALFYWEFPK